MTDERRIKVSSDGLFRQNIVLMSGLVTAPIIVAATSALRALVLVMSFFMVSYSCIILCRLIPRKISYSIRIICYAVMAGIMYVPTLYLLNRLFPDVVREVQLYMDIVVINSLLLAKTETRFYLKPWGEMALDALVYIVGYAIAAFAVGIVREALAFGTLFGFRLFDPVVPSAKSPFFGFILVGIYAALCRVIVGKRAAVKRSRELARERFRIEIDFDDEDGE